LKQIFYDEGHVILVLEGITCDLRTHMTYWPASGGSRNFIYLKDLLCGIAYCHSLEVFHRDLKPEAILIDLTGALKLGDLGTARSIGCIFFEMLVAKKQQERKLFHGKSEIDMWQEIFSKLGTPDEQTWPGVSSLPGFAFGFPKYPPQVI
ncbi:hypothetical protein ACJW30_07G007300, partial [Castanea mollissima]